MELKNKLEEIKFDGDKDINIFMAKLQNTIDKLEKIDLTSSTKVGILNRALPENIRWINVFQYKDDWLKCFSYVRDTIPEILSSNQMEYFNMKIYETKNIFIHKTKIQKTQIIKETQKH